MKYNPNGSGHQWYYDKGIKCRITIDELKYLWFRDKAYLMEKLSIDRRNSTKDYTLDNCRYTELRINVQNKHKEHIRIKIPIEAF
jgi:hypothetical protein